MGALKALGGLLFPARCPFCRRLLKVVEDGLCASCQKLLPWVEKETPDVPGKEFDVCVAPLWYRDVVRQSFHRYKFDGVKCYAEAYGKLVGQCVCDRLAGRYDLITWAPLSRQRKWKRGYDQAYLIAASAAKELKRPLIKTLRKVRNPQAQSSMDSADARRANVRDCYEAVKPALVRDKRVLLIDDIVTTGSTLSECARTLKEAGAREVVCAAFARTGKENGPLGRTL